MFESVLVDNKLFIRVGKANLISIFFRIFVTANINCVLASLSIILIVQFKQFLMSELQLHSILTTIGIFLCKLCLQACFSYQTRDLYLELLIVLDRLLWKISHPIAFTFRWRSSTRNHWSLHDNNCSRITVCTYIYTQV